MKHGTFKRIVAGSTCLFLPIAILPPGPDDAEIKTIASWYGPGFHGRRTASGERFNQNAMTAANRTLPFGTKVRVRNLRNGRTCTVVINDRGPFVKGRGIDLSAEAARRLGISGIAQVCYSTVPAYKPQPKPAVESIETIEPVEPGGPVEQIEPVEGVADIASLPEPKRVESVKRAEAAVSIAKESAPEPFERQIASLRSSLLIEQPVYSVATEEVPEVVVAPAVKKPQLKQVRVKTAQVKQAQLKQVQVKQPSVKAVRPVANAQLPKPMLKQQARMNKQAATLKQLAVKHPQLKVAKTKKVKQYIARGNQKRYRHSSRYLAHSSRKQSLKVARSVHRFGMKVASFCKGLRGIFASI